MASSHGTVVDPAITKIAAEAVAYALGGMSYAVVGGAACSLLGSGRLTSDVDFVVPKGRTKEARASLQSQHTYFQVEARTKHTSYKSDPPVEIEILTPPMLFKGEFTTSTPCVEVNGVKVLKPTLLLEAKCRCAIERSSDEKRRTDLDDIDFLLRWCAQNGMRPTQAEVPSATKEIVSHLIRGRSNSEKLWADAGYDHENGLWSA